MKKIPETRQESPSLTQKLTPVEFGRLVKVERKNRHLTQEELGAMLFKELGLENQAPQSARVAISRIERGLYDTEEDRVEALAKILDLKEPKSYADDSYAMMMTELAKVCGRLTTVEMSSVIAYAKTLLERRS